MNIKNIFTTFICLCKFTNGFNVVHHNFNPIHFTSDLYDTIIPNENKQALGEFIVKETTSILPKADYIGTLILNANDQLISDLFENPHISIDFKKPIILKLISIAIHGEEVGSQMMHLYYDLVDHVL